MTLVTEDPAKHGLDAGRLVRAGRIRLSVRFFRAGTPTSRPTGPDPDR